MGCSVLQAELEQRSQSSQNLQGEREQASHHHVPPPALLSVCFCTLSVPFFKLWDLTPLLGVMHRQMHGAAPHGTSNCTSQLCRQPWGTSTSPFPSHFCCASSSRSHHLLPRTWYRLNWPWKTGTSTTSPGHPLLHSPSASRSPEPGPLMHSGWLLAQSLNRVQLSIFHY